MTRIILVLSLYLAVQTSFAQLQSPKEFLGYELGTRFSRHHQVVDYFEHAAENSPKLQLIEYGKTYEGRPLLLAFISTEENLKNLDQIRTDNLKRANLLEGSPSGNTPIIWLSYNVHGNEASSTEVSMRTAFELIRESSDKADWLENSLIIIDPCINPDGRDRYANFYNQYGNFPFNPDPQTAEHNEPWPGGRQNHYLFDLNRDWAWQTQVETQGRIEVYNQWMPQIHVDFHEQGYNSPYYFAPAAEPYHELITDWQRDFQDQIGRNHAKYFDEKDWFYFTKQRFDLLYPSYGDTYPTYSGAIGMTYEQAGHGRGGLGIIKKEGDTLSLKDRIDHHTTTGLSTIEVTVANSDRVLSEFEKFFDTPVPGKYKSFVLKSQNADKRKALMSWLDKNGIRYGTSSGSKLSGYNYASKRNQSFTLNRDDIVISTAQPRGLLAKVLFEPVTKVTDSLTYDITAWAAPYIYGMEAYATSASLNVSPLAEAAAFTTTETPDDAYAFFVEWNSLADATFLAALLKEGVKVRFSSAPMSINGKRYNRGTLIVSERDNDPIEDFEGLVTSIANEMKQELKVVNTGYMDRGPDVGSSDVVYLDAPRVATVAGEGASVTNFGAMWHFLEQELQYPVSHLWTSDLAFADLSDYDVILMQEGRYSSFGEREKEKLSGWVRDGGRLILFGSAIRKFADSDYASISRYNSEEEKSKMEKRQATIEENNKLLPYASQEREYAKNIIPGAIFRVTIDNTHPMAYGYDRTYFSLKTSGQRYGYLSDQNVGIIEGKDDHMSGFAGQYVKEKLPKSLVFGVEDRGRGQIVYFVDNPLFRNFWYSGKLMVANSIFFVGQ
ncbi:MAG: M14 metallopeptidase family protein [Cyclobacteriaceae bacterium]